MSKVIDGLDFNQFEEDLLSAFESIDSNPEDVTDVQMFVSQYLRAIAEIMGNEGCFINRLEDLQASVGDRVSWPEPVREVVKPVMEKDEPEKIKVPEIEMPDSNKAWNEFVLDNLIGVSFDDLVKHLWESLPSNKNGLKKVDIESHVTRMIKEQQLFILDGGDVCEVTSLPPEEGWENAA